MVTWQLLIVYYAWTAALAVIVGPAINRELGEGNVFERIFLWIRRGVDAGWSFVTRRHAK